MAHIAFLKSSCFSGSLISSTARYPPAMPSLISAELQSNPPIFSTILICCAAAARESSRSTTRGVNTQHAPVPALMVAMVLAADFLDLMEPVRPSHLRQGDAK